MNDMTRPDVDPPYLHPEYRSTQLRSPKEPLLELAPGTLDVPGAYVPRGFVKSGDNDLTVRGKSLPIGERMVVSGRLLDESGRPLRDSLVEIWQANASGRYDHPGDQHDAPLDPNFHGNGRVFTDADGWYQFVSVKPGSYPWGNHHNAWRPNHIHYSLFGTGFGQRLITQMYFPGDPLLDLDPIYLSVPDRAARERLIAKFDIEITRPSWALGYRFDFVLRGRNATPTEQH